MSYPRNLESLIRDPKIKDKMIILAGPRQVGKTTLAKQWLKETKHDNLYFNWDEEQTRRFFRKEANFFESQARQYPGKPRIVFDEIHKISRWRTVLKGYYDRFHEDFDFFITGSAKLELLQKIGDSMLGRYHLLHLLPLTPHEVERKKVFPSIKNFQKNYENHLKKTPLRQATINTLLKFSGFPEPFSKSNQRSLNLWHREYRQRMIREDLRDLTRLHDLSRVENCFEILPSKVASPLSLNSLREDLFCSYDAVQSIISAFEKLYVILKLRPYSTRIQNTIKKEPKIYFLDWTYIQNDGARFENFLAIQLKNYCNLLSDGGYGEFELFYVRDKQKREVDFLVTRKGQPHFLAEAKLQEDKNLTAIQYFAKQLGNIPCFCVTLEEKVFRKIKKDFFVVSVNRFLNTLWE